jgi:hypothetical protein
MEEIELELTDMSRRAEIYTRKGNEHMKSFGYGMMSVIHDIQDLILSNKENRGILEKIKKEVIRQVGHEGNKIDMELHYDNKLFCRSISNGGRTNNYYFNQVIKRMERKGYDPQKFEIKVGDDVYIQ